MSLDDSIVDDEFSTEFQELLKRIAEALERSTGSQQRIADVLPRIEESLDLINSSLREKLS